MASLDCSYRASKSKETQIWESENETVPSRQRLLLQLLFVIAAFILQTQRMLW